ncbi:type II and III secretion system protein family protein [Moritella sp. 36]|uniref:type II and III secretion system protein family protein n=1 Tax=Moritella sp. 36 TaxID=2746233 RepID=UPI001BAC647F|nr:type II and III secretion system protein family protein [Moritella sp. 36]QUM88791.1 type II and III secretion system protein family protein [Moritella sp. 36]
MIKQLVSALSLLLLSTLLQAQTLDVVLNKARLVVLPKTAKSIFIASNGIADYQTLTNTKIMVFGKKTGSTSLYVLDAKENVIYSATVKVNHNVIELNALIHNEFPDAIFNAESTAGKLFLKGQVPTPSMAEKIVRLSEGYVSALANTESSDSKEGSNTQNSTGSDNKDKSAENKIDKDELINQLQVTMPNQVNLRIRIAEVSRKVSNKLGIKWGSQGFGTGTFSFLDSSGGNIGGLNPAGWADLSVIVDALATNGMMSVLAEPNLTAMSGEEASFLVGGEIPIPLVYGDTASIEYKKFGVKLDFKPIVLSANQISLQVFSEVSSVSSETSIQIGGSSLPTFVSRQASTTVELASGQSFALGGLLQSKDIEQLQKMPLLGDIPVLGALFRSTSFQREETELIIIATAYLVQPTRADSLPLPTDGLIPMSDVERLLAWPVSRDVTNSTDNESRTNNRQPRLLGDNGFYY